MVFRQNVLYVYTDGSSLQSPRRGGIGIRFIYIDEDGEEQIQDIQSPGYKEATNNQMELMACALALEEAFRLQLHQGRMRIIIRTDSMYIAENYQKAMFQWPANKWLRRSGAPVLNADLWKRLTKAMKKVGIRVDYEWVRGHSKDEHNKAVDRLARKSAKSATEAPLSLVHVRRKRSNESVQLGSVEINGQRMSIRIITTEYLDMHKVWKCKYEVITKNRDDYMMVDIIYSDELLSAGHSYYVKVNDEQDNPRVVKIYHEIEN